MTTPSFTSPAYSVIFSTPSASVVIYISNPSNYSITWSTNQPHMLIASSTNTQCVISLDPNYYVNTTGTLNAVWNGGAATTEISISVVAAPTTTPAAIIQQYTILPQYNQVVSNGKMYTLSPSLSTYPSLFNISVVQILGDSAVIEFTKSSGRSNEIGLASTFQYIIDQVELLKNPPPVIPTLAEAKQAAIRSIFNSYNDERYKGVTTNGIKMPADVSEVQLLQFLHDFAVKLNQSTVDVIDYNNITHPGISITVVDSMITDIMINYQTLTTKKQTLSAQINNATTVAQVEAIVW